MNCRPVNNRGLTLVELLVASSIGVLVCGTVFFMVSVAAETSRGLMTRYKLLATSIVVKQTVTADVQQGAFVGYDLDNRGALVVPKQDSVFSRQVYVYDRDGRRRSRLRFDDGILYRDETALRAFSGVQAAEGQSGFVVYPGGVGLGLQLRLQEDSPAARYARTERIEGVWCRN